MATEGPLQSLIRDSDEEDDDFFDLETGLFSVTEANKPILDFSDSELDSDDELPSSSATNLQNTPRDSLMSVLSNETPEIPEILLFEIEYIEITGSILLVV